jgi:hypothetical protein
LIQEPAIEHQVHRAIRGLDLHGAQQSFPEAAHDIEGDGDPLGRAAAPDERGDAGRILRFAQEPDHRSLFGRLERESHLNGAARIKRSARLVGKGLSLERRRMSQRAIPSEKLGSIARDRTKARARRSCPCV